VTLPPADLALRLLYPGVNVLRSKPPHACDFKTQGVCHATPADRLSFLRRLNTRPHLEQSWLAWACAPREPPNALATLHRQRRVSQSKSGCHFAKFLTNCPPQSFCEAVRAPLSVPAASELQLSAPEVACGGDEFQKSRGFSSGPPINLSRERTVGVLPSLKQLCASNHQRADCPFAYVVVHSLAASAATRSSPPARQRHAGGERHRRRNPHQRLQGHAGAVRIHRSRPSHACNSLFCSGMARPERFELPSG
jgi:hypothetical protein